MMRGGGSLTAMRTTITLAPDVAAAVEERMRRDHVGRSEAVNALIRTGLTARPEKPRYELPSHDLGLKIDITCMGEALGLLDEWDAEEAAARNAG